MVVRRGGRAAVDNVVVEDNERANRAADAVRPVTGLQQLEKPFPRDAVIPDLFFRPQELDRLARHVMAKDHVAAALRVHVVEVQDHLDSAVG
eukprot:683254-Prymnesium_polylepis.1